MDVDLSDSAICSDIIREFQPGGNKDKVLVSVVRDFFIRKYPHIRTDQKRGRLFRKAFEDIGHRIRRMTPGSRRLKKKPKVAFYYYVRMVQSSVYDNMEISDATICSDIINKFKPGGKNDRVPEPAVRAFFIRKHPHIKTEKKRRRLFRKAFKKIGHRICRIQPGSRKRIGVPYFYYYVRMENTVDEDPEDLDRETPSNSELGSRNGQQNEALDTSINEDMRQCRIGLEDARRRRLEAKDRIDLLETMILEDRDEYMMEEAGIIDDVNRLRKVLMQEQLRSEMAEQRAKYVAERLSQEQDIRWKAVQDLSKIKPLSHRHIPELDHNQVSDLNKTIGSGTFGQVRLCHYRGQNVAVKDFSKNPRGLPVAKLEKCVLREANMMLSFKPHPNVVNIFGYMRNTVNVRDDNSSGLSMVTEHVNGTSLWTLINLEETDDKKRGLPWKHILKETADGVIALHAMNIIHNDLKEDNIMIREEDRRPVIIDFGKATFADKPRWVKYKLSTEEVKEWREEYPWVAPELLEDKVPPSRSTDTYSYGFICFSVYQSTSCKDDATQKVWESLYKSDPRDRSNMEAAINLFE